MVRGTEYLGREPALEPLGRRRLVATRNRPSFDWIDRGVVGVFQ
jgi:hypothetical protein